MMMVLRKIGIAALLLAGMAGASASHGDNWEQRDAARLERQQQWAQASQARRDEGQGPRQGEQRQYGGGGQAQPGGYGQQQGGFGQPPGGFGQPPQDDGRRSGRMSPEERRELRRQIDEAGRNIYSPRR